MRVHTCAVFGFVALMVAAAPVWAQEAKAIEVTPYVALGSAAAPPIGAMVTVPLTSNLSIETELGYRSGEGDINALSTSTSPCGCSLAWGKHLRTLLPESGWLSTEGLCFR